MVPFSVFLVITTLCGISHAQRKLSRNIAIAADVKAGVNFDCPEEFGYYPHPNDCTQYYVCVFGGALLESCTGGLMYSHELQTCDWPRNVGCDGLGDAPSPSTASPPKQREETRTRFTPPPPPPQPAAVVTSRGQPRNLHHNQQEIIKQQQQQQLYAETEESLPPAEEVENDRQQRVYRGQPSTIGQVQRDRDGLRHTNAIPTYNSRSEKIGVISFGIHQNQDQQQYSDLTSTDLLTNELTFKRRKKRQASTRVETTTTTTVAPSATATARALYNTSRYTGNAYDSYYPLYDDDVELYKDVEYSQQNNYNSGSQQQQSTTGYRRTPSPTSTSAEVETPKRGNVAFIQTNYNTQDIYQQPGVSDYNDDNYQQGDDQANYRPSSRQPASSSRLSQSRGDRNEISVEDKPQTTTNRIIPKPTKKEPKTTTSRTVKSTAPSSSQPPPEKQTQLSNFTFPESPGLPPPSITPRQFTLSQVDTLPSDSLHAPLRAVEPAPFSLPIAYHITKPPKSTDQVSESIRNLTHDAKTFIVPTTYSPPKFFLKSILPRSFYTQPFALRNKSVSPANEDDRYVKTLKAVRKLINPLAVNNELLELTAEREVVTPSTFRYQEKSSTIPTTTEITSTVPTTTSTTTTTTERPNFNSNHVKNSKLRHYLEPKQPFRNTVEVPSLDAILRAEEDQEKHEPDESPSYKPVFPKTTPASPSLPARVSRVNAAIKSMIALGGARVKQTSNSSDNKLNNESVRTPSRGRGHYTSSGNTATNEVAVNVNRGTSPPRSRPTLKPSTSIVSKAQEFVDVYRFPPRRPDPIYPQPQPDKTAAKCRKDVCLLPDCSCGGKEIPGDIPVEQVPQIVLLTFDDSVNDLNKGLYSDLFEKNRANPNGCPISATFYVSHEWTDYSQVQNLYSDGHEIASHTVSHSFGEQFSQKKWTREVAGQREILAAYGGVHLEDVRGMRAPFLSVGGNKMFKMLYDSNFTYDSSMPIYENKPPSWPYTLDYKLFHDCMIPPCPTRSYPGVWEVPMVMWQDLNGGRCSMGDACSNPSDPDGVFKMIMKNFQRHYTTNRAPFGLFYHAAWFTQPHHKEGFIQFLDAILAMKDVWVMTNWQAVQWVRDPTPTSRLGNFQPFQCDFSDRPKRCNNAKVCNLWHKSGVRYMRTCQPCPDIYPWTGQTGIRSSKIDNDIED